MRFLAIAMISVQELKRSFWTALWFMLLTFPIMVIRVNTIDQTIQWRWDRMVMVGVGAFGLSILWRFFMRRRPANAQDTNGATQTQPAVLRALRRIGKDPRVARPAMGVVLLFCLALPLIVSWNRTIVMTNVLIYVVLGLGLNLVVGLAGLLNLGYAAFFAVGAYSYALLNHHFGLGFWAALPVGAALGAGFGILLALPVLRLRGDYLAIVTLGFGEIIRLVLENWNAFSFGPSGIDNIAPPGLFGLSLTLQQTHTFIYYLMIALTLLTVGVVRRLENSRTGRAWVALREDEIACQAMGIDKTRAKLSAFALGSTWAGMAGVVFAAKQKFINPYSFTIWESIMILCIIVLGGMGSIPGVMIGGLIMVLLPELLKEYSEYRWLLFGAILVLMMVFRPGGIVSDTRKVYAFEPEDGEPRHE
jgi:branched-chain amino acid transport system permease protein